MKTVLITGSGGGIGQETAKLFAANGYNVALHYNTSETCVTKLKRELEQTASGRIISVQADFTLSENVTRAFDTVVSEFGGVDVLVNNAGAAFSALVTDTEEQDYDRIFSVNMKSVFLLTNLALKGMISKKFGKIINVSSVWGVVGASCEVAYSASKAALVGYTKALAKEVGLSGVNVNCVCPGVIDTPMNKNLSKDDLQALVEQTPLYRLGKPKDVAQLIFFLSEEKSDFITGQIIGCDGGFGL